MCVGVTQLAPELLNFDDFEEISDLAEPSWVLSGTEVFHGGVPLESDYPLDLDAVPMGSNVGIMVTSNKELHFFQDGRDMGCAAKDIPPGNGHCFCCYGDGMSCICLLRKLFFRFGVKSSKTIFCLGWKFMDCTSCLSILRVELQECTVLWMFMGSVLR